MWKMRDYAWTRWSTHILLALTGLAKTNLSNIGLQKFFYKFQVLKDSIADIAELENQIKDEFEFQDDETMQIEDSDLNKIAVCLQHIAEIDPNEADHIYEKTVNILLLGQTGCGKSTFINSFVNYMNYQELNRVVLNTFNAYLHDTNLERV